MVPPKNKLDHSTGHACLNKIHKENTFNSPGQGPNQGNPLAIPHAPPSDTNKHFRNLQQSGTENFRDKADHSRCREQQQEHTSIPSLPPLTFILQNPDVVFSAQSQIHCCRKNRMLRQNG